jgi:transcription elongation factor Elf1
MDEQKKTSCPNCGSEQISITEKALNGKKGIAGAIAIAAAGVLAGKHKSNDILAICSNCGESWEPSLFHRSKQKSYEIWKASIFHHYDKGNYDEAARIYLTRRTFSSKWPDIHSACYGKKKVDRMRSVMKVGMSIIILIIIISVFFHRNHMMFRHKISYEYNSHMSI